MTDKEKLITIKELADAMYTKMQNLTTDTSGIRKAMEEYHQFVIQEYYKKDLVNEDLGTYVNELSKQFPEVSFAKLSRIAVRVAKWQKEYLLKLSDGNDLSESISGNLEKAAREYSCIRSAENIDEYAEYDFEKYNAFKAGAEWKNKQMQPIIEVARDIYKQRVKYPSVKDGIKSHAETYSFNIESVLFNQLTKEQQELWRKEIEQAYISGGDAGVEFARDIRYPENSWSSKVIPTFY